MSSDTANTVKRLHPWAGMLSGAVLLVLAFPSWNQPWAAWVALLPWFWALRGGATPKQAFWRSYVLGYLFFIVSMYWLIHVTLIGWLLLCLYLALYFAVFGALAARLLDARPALALAGIPAAWTALEFGRSHLLSGLGWNLLGYSQSSWPVIIQVAETTGVWGVSFLIVAVNVALFQAANVRRSVRFRLTHAALALALVSVAAGYGAWRMAGLAPEATVRVAVTQGNIPQEQKWDEVYVHQIIERYADLTQQAAALDPQLIIWPETSAPGYLGLEEELTQQVFSIADAADRPLLVGAPTMTINPEGMQLRNSAMVVRPGKALSKRYDKVHLVPFGEFVPFERALFWLRHILPPIGTFTPGTAFTVFESSEEPSPHATGATAGLVPFSTLICFEDVFPGLARSFARAGAQFLVVITNDAWFGPTGAAYQHAQASTFRAVELRLPVARAANTGWSGCIDPAGRWIASVHDESGRELFVPGVAVCDLPLVRRGTAYQRWGDWFAWLCLALAAAAQAALRKKPGLTR